jgi:hypothetical protein
MRRCEPLGGAAMAMEPVALDAMQSFVSDITGDPVDLLIQARTIIPSIA